MLPWNRQKLLYKYIIKHTSAMLCLLVNTEYCIWREQNENQDCRYRLNLITGVPINITAIFKHDGHPLNHTSQCSTRSCTRWKENLAWSGNKIVKSARWHFNLYKINGYEVDSCGASLNRRCAYLTNTSEYSRLSWDLTTGCGFWQDIRNAKFLYYV